MRLPRSAKQTRSKRDGHRGEVSLAYNPNSRAPGLRISNYKQTTKVALKLVAFHTASTTATVQVADVFWFNMFTDAAYYTQLYDEYRIDALEVWIVPSATVATATDPETGYFCSAVDLNDNTATTIDHLETQNNSLETNALTAHYHKYVPCCADGPAGSITNAGNPWCSLVDGGGVTYYGLKTAFSICDHPLKYTYFYTCHVSLRGQATH